MYSCMYRFTGSKIMLPEIWTKLLPCSCVFLFLNHDQSNVPWGLVLFCIVFVCLFVCLFFLWLCFVVGRGWGTTLLAVVSQGRTLHYESWETTASNGQLFHRACASTRGLCQNVTCFGGNIREYQKTRRQRERQKKAIGLISKTTTLHMDHAFLCISLPFFARLKCENA